MGRCKWLRDGSWIRIDEDTPTEEILDVVQHVFDDMESQPMLMSLRGGPWPDGVWHWEPDGNPSSTEPTHYRKRAAVALRLSETVGATLQAQGEKTPDAETPGDSDARR